MRKGHFRGMKAALPGAMALLLLASCERRPAASPAPPEISGLTAYQLTKAAVDFGPRPAGSEASLRMLEWIAAEARTAGASKVYFDEFQESTYVGKIKFRNLVVEIEGASERFLIVGAHHDTKRLVTEPGFLGANDGGSGVGMALEMMKKICLTKSVPPHSLKFVFFDGEECFVEYSATDGLFGSRKLAKEWAAKGLLSKCDGMILLDMIGDADLNIAFPADSDKALMELALKTAKEKGYSDKFSLYELDMVDDHRPFQEQGVPAIDFIDFSYGSQNHYWHTAGDTMDKLAGESFTAVGQIVMEMLWRIPVR